MPQVKIFIDSDVVISSLVSETGASYYLLNQTRDLKLTLSNYSDKELRKVCTKLNIDKILVSQLIKNRFKLIKLEKTTQEIKTEFKDYTIDPNDTHIVAGAKLAQARFLITYNLKDFRVDKIKKDLGIHVTTPAKLLQYLRSIK